MQDEIISPETAEAVGEYLTFKLNQEEYAVPITKVKEIRAWEPVTRIPHAKSWECGLVNVRGAIVPIFDLRKRIGLTDVAYTSHTVVIMFSIELRGKERVQGVVVDALTDVVKFSSSQIQPSPQIRASRPLRFAQGVVEYEGRMVIMLDLMKALELEANDAAANLDNN